jgi:transcriptional regulator with XRE-family HTH domain
VKLIYNQGLFSTFKTGQAMSKDDPNSNSYGYLLKYWRNVRQLNQMELSLRCDTSARHLSCVETERAQPSRHLLLRVCTELQIPLRARNTILISAGYAPIYRETGLSEPEMEETRHVLNKILEQNNPFPAMVMNRDLDILMSNSGFRAYIAHVVKDRRILNENWNLLRLLFHPDGMASYIANLPYVYHTMAERARRNLMAGNSERLTTVLAEIEQYRPRETVNPTDNLAQLIMPVHIEKDGQQLNFYTLSATLGLPLNITLQEMHVECGYPVDDASEQLLKKLTASLDQDQPKNRQ